MVAEREARSCALCELFGADEQHTRALWRRLRSRTAGARRPHKTSRAMPSGPRQDAK